MVDDARALLDNSGADLWVVQQDTLGPYAEPSSVPDDLYRDLTGFAGVERAANVTSCLVGKPLNPYGIGKRSREEAANL